MELSIVILTVLLATICNGKQSTTGANKFLKSMWKTYFKADDVNHDGVFSMEDLKEARSKFSELYHSQHYEILDKWWNECVVRGKTGRVTQSDFIAAYDKAFTRDKKEFHNRIEQCQELLFYDIIDANKDRLISLEEYNIIMKVFGHANVVLNTKFFQSYDPVNNLIHLQTLMNSWVDFQTNEDAAKENKVKNNLKAGA